MDEQSLARNSLLVLRQYYARSAALRRQAVVNLANYIYNECYPGMNDLSDTSHYVAKASEIAGWLESGDYQDATLEGLVEEWKGYDSQEEESDE